MKPNPWNLLLLPLIPFAYIAIKRVVVWLYRPWRRWRDSRPPKPPKPWPAPRSFTRRSMLTTLTGGALMASALIVLGMCALFLLMRSAGRMTDEQTAASCLLVFAVMLICAIPIYKITVAPLIPLLHGRDGRQLLERATVEYMHGYWLYADQDWFVRVEKGSSCALYAPSIDFTAPVRVVTVNYIDYLGGKDTGRVYPCKALAFERVRRKAITVRTEPDEEMLKWIEAHGGRVI